VDRLVLLAVIVLALTVAAFAFAQFLDTSRLLWGSLVHDRNAHYLFGLSIAQDIQHGDLRRLLADLDGARTWPPLHGILVAVVLLIGGTSAHLAVLPSLAGWVGTIVFGFLTARRMAPRYGNLSGFLTAVFILVSPAHRVFATDIMLESLGACFSLLAVWLYMVVLQNRPVWAQRALALTLTALFFQKYNYWLLVILALAGAEVSSRPQVYLTRIRRLLASIDWAYGARRSWRNPLNYVLAVLVVLLMTLVFGDGHTVQVGGQSVSIHSPHNLLHLMYIVLFVRVAWWWFHGGRAAALDIDPCYRRILVWHGIPIAVWFLWPKRLGYWLWYLFANSGENPQHDLSGSVAYYAMSAGNDYHIGWWSAALATGLLVAGMITIRQMRPGANAVLFLLLIGALATVPHPNRKSRFLHSWMPAGWAVAGAGAANLLPRRWPRALRPAGPAMTASTAGVIALFHAQGFVSAGDSPERGHHDYLPASTRDLTDYYLPALADSEHPAVFSTMEIKHLLRWSFMEKGGLRDKLEVDWKRLVAPHPTLPHDEKGSWAQRIEAWLEATRCDTLVLIDIPPATYWHEKTNQNEVLASQLQAWLASQSVFRLAQQRHFSMYGCRVSVYRRASLLERARLENVGPVETNAHEGPGLCRRDNLGALFGDEIGIATQGGADARSPGHRPTHLQQILRLRH
jgi:hypothetical protein